MKGAAAASKRRTDPSFAKGADGIEVKPSPALACRTDPTFARSTEDIKPSLGAASKMRRRDPSFAQNTFNTVDEKPRTASDGRIDPSFAKSGRPEAAEIQPSRKPAPKGRPSLPSSLLSVLLHLLIFGLLLRLPQHDKAGNGPGAEETTITVAFVPLGEGQGQEPAQEGKHAAAPDATSGAPQTAPELAAPSDTGTKAAAAAPEGTAEPEPKPTPPAPDSPTQQPNENRNTQESLNDQPKGEPGTETPTPASKPLTAERAPATTEEAPAPPASETPPPVEKKVAEAPAVPKEELRPKASAPPPPPTAQPKLAELPPAAKITEAPPESVVHLPPKSSFKPGTLGDIKRSEVLGRLAGLPGEVGGSGSAAEAGGGIGAPGPPGGGTPTERKISELQARIDRMLLVYQPDYPDVVVLQRQVDKLFADEGPLRPEELAETGRRLEACWQRARASLGLANHAVALSLVLGRDGSVRDAKIADADLGKAVPAAQMRETIRACGPLPLPPERYLLWQNFTMQVGG
jgi:hypothetical protein